MLVCAVAAASALCAASASAAPMRPATAGPLSSPFNDLASIVPQSQSSPLCGSRVCYTPSFLAQAYDFPGGRNAPTGAGQTILIVDAYGAPDIEQDLATFDAAYGIPAPPSFAIVHQARPVPRNQGSGAFFAWEKETSLDVEYAHAMAPGANIVLAVASSDDSADLAQVESEALPRYPGAIVSQSFGQDETGPASDPSFLHRVRRVYLKALEHGGTILADSGDFGASNGTEFEGVTPSLMASSPASSPLVLAVGGTEGNPYPGGLWQNGGYGGEQVWNEPQFGAAAGGAPSVVFPAPPWQVGVTGVSGRAVPDVSYNAAVNGGVVVILSCLPDPTGALVCDPSHPRAGVIGGTSVGSPNWSAILALANELRGRQGVRPVGLVAPLLYSILRDGQGYRRDFHDIVVGSNQLVGSAFGFSAQPGYDLASGIGTPDVSALVRDLAQRDADSESFDDGGSASGDQPLQGGHGHVDPGK